MNQMLQNNKKITLDAENIFQLANSIIEKHRTEGIHSPLDPGTVAKLNYKLGQAKAYHDESEKYRSLCVQAQQKRDSILGSDERTLDDKNLVIDYLKLILSQLEEGTREQFMKAAS